MQQTRATLQPAFILHRRPWRDTSLLIDALTPEFGRIALVARGVRGKRSARAAMLQPFQPLLLSWSGRGEMYTLVDVEASGHRQALQGKALISGFYLNELLMRLLQRHDPHPELYQGYQLALSRLQSGKQLEWTLRLFECALLEQMGYGLQLEYRADSGEALEPAGQYVYLHERGPVPAAQAEGLPLQGNTLQSLAAAHWPMPEEDAQLLREAKHLLRQTLARYLGPRPLASRALFRSG